MFEDIDFSWREALSAIVTALKPRTWAERLSELPLSASLLWLPYSVAATALVGLFAAETDTRLHPAHHRIADALQPLTDMSEGALWIVLGAHLLPALLFGLLAACTLRSSPDYRRRVLAATCAGLTLPAGFLFYGLLATAYIVLRWAPYGQRCSSSSTCSPASD